MYINWSNLIGDRLKVEISEPWEAAGILQNTLLLGTIKNIKDNAVLIKLDERVEVGSCSFIFLVAEIRYEGENFTPNNAYNLMVNLTAIHSIDDQNEDLFEIAKKYRGGCEFIGSVQKVNNNINVSKDEFSLIEKQQRKWELEKKIDTARKIAEDSWKNHNYRELISAYKPIIDYLSPLEMKKYQYAIKKSKGPNKN